MGTHPIFESDFDCLTDWSRSVFIMSLLKTYEQQFGNSTADATAKIASFLRTGRETPDAAGEMSRIKRQIQDDLKEQMRFWNNLNLKFAKSQKKRGKSIKE